MPETLEKPTGTKSLEWRKQKAAMLAKANERRAYAVDSSGFDIRENDDGTLTLVGYASVYDRFYDMGWYREKISRGAGKRSLGETPDVQLLVNHTDLPLARTLSGTLRLEERALDPEIIRSFTVTPADQGLYVEADLDPEDPDVTRLVRKMKRRDIDQMSFAFRVTDDEWNDDFTERTIRSYSIHRGDVSVVNMGANEHASASVRSTAAEALHTRSRAEVVDALFEIRVGKKLSASTVEILTNVLSLTSDAEDASGEARALLDGLINPTEGEDEAVERSIENEKDVCAAIRAVVREPGKDERRAEIIERAKALDVGGLIPDAWAPDGALAEGRALDGQEQRETHNDTYEALQGALDDVLVTNGDYWYVWVQDFTDTDVIYRVGGDVWSAPYTLVPGGECSIDIENAKKVRPVTEYVERAKPQAEVEPEPQRSHVPDFTTRARHDLDLLALRGRR